MSPRSRDFWEMALDRLDAADITLTAGAIPAAVSSAYYAMLYAARAALSEEDAYAKSHRGTWMLFRERFVLSGRFEEAVFEEAQGVKPKREAADYDAQRLSEEEGRATVAIARRFVEGVGTLLGE